MRKFSIFDESFNITEAKIRSIRPIVLPTSFQDATMGPFTTFSMSTITLMDKSGCRGEAPVFGSYINIMESCIFPILLNSERSDYAALSDSLYWAIRNEGFRGPAAALLGQVDMALHDLAAVRNDVPLYRYLNAERDWATVYGSGCGTNYSLKELEKEILSFLDHGMKTIKIKVGKNNGKSIKGDIERVQFVRKLIGKDISLAVDANQVWNAETALLFSHEIEDQQIAWFEEPVHSADISQIKALCSSCPIPVSYGESERSGKVFPALIKAGVKHFQPIPGYLASINEWMNVNRLAEEGRLCFSAGGFSH
jgi:L-alanine-DL-glutamate epimerase-like enolase superfamily enzyme